MKIEYKRKSYPRSGDECDLIHGKGIYCYLKKARNVRRIKKYLVRRLRRSSAYIIKNELND